MRIVHNFGFGKKGNDTPEIMARGNTHVLISQRKMRLYADVIEWTQAKNCFSN